MTASESQHPASEVGSEFGLQTDPAGRRRDGMVQRAAWASASLLIALLLLSFYQQPIGLAAGFGIALLLLLAARRPYAALLLLAALGPLSTMLALLARIDAGGLRLFEAMTLAVAAGWAARHAHRPSAPRVSESLLWSSAILIAAALASAVITGSVSLTEQHGTLVRGLSRDSGFRTYPVTWDAFSAALLFAEGLVLFVMVADICAEDARRRERVLHMMVLGAAAAATFNVFRIISVSLAREHPWQAFQTYLFSLRVNVHYGDLNAAGSYFAMMLIIAIGMTGRTPVAAILSALIAAALWLVGSRTALVAVGVMALVAGVVRVPAGWPRRAAAGLLAAGLAVAAFGLWTRAQSERHVATPALAATIRLRLAGAALQMTADNPLFGVGLGHFFERSQQYAAGPFYKGQRGLVERENAHNNFLQIAGELGIPGGLLFLAVIALALRACIRGVGPLRFPLVIGLMAFLLTCLAGHPLLVSHVAYAFWMALGVAAAYGSGDLVAWRRLRLVAIPLVMIFVVSLPFRTAAAVRRADVEHTTIGLSLWQREADGSRYRWAGGRSTFFVPSPADAVGIPLRHGSEGPERLEVRILLNGREANRILLERSDGWRSVNLPLTPRTSAAFHRIDLEAGEPGAQTPLDAESTNRGGLLRVGRPVIRGKE
jgi:O-antigen ligase